MDKEDIGVIHIKKGVIDYTINARFKEEGGMYSVYIPSFDIYFSAPTMDEADRRVTVMMDSFFHFWITQQGWKKFVMEIHKLGFRAKGHALAMKNLLNHRPVDAKLNSLDGNIPPEFDSSLPNVTIRSAQQEVAV